MKMFDVKLDKRWKEVIYAASGFGPNLLMTLMIAYFTDAVIPTGLNADVNFWSYGGVVIVSTIIFPILWTIGRIFDGVIDVPLAALTDKLRNKTGKRNISLIVSFLPMLVSFALCWIPVFGKGADISVGQQVGNSIWIFFWSIIFFASYTLALITFYGSLSDVCENQTQRARVSAYKSVFDTVNYALVYAAIPAIFKAVNIPIWQVALYLLPLMLTILIPILLSKKGDTPNKIVSDDANVPILTSIKLTLKSKPFIKWTIVNCVAFFGLQMFLVSQNTLISGIMNLGAGYAALLNTCAFAPVPIMLYFFNKVRKSKGIRFAYQTCLLAFGFAIFSFAVGSQYVFGDNVTPKLIIGAVGGIVGSWGIGGFFMVPYLIPTVIASVEEEVTGKNHSAMYFAVQALATSIVGAIASSLIYNYLKLWTAPSPMVQYEWKCGVSLVPLIVAIFCFIGFFLCFLMPKKYTAKVIYDDILASSKGTKKHLLKKKEKVNNEFLAKKAEITVSGIPQIEKDSLINDLQNKLNIKLAKIDLEIEREEKIINFKFNESTSSANEEVTTIYETSNILADIFLYFLSGFIFNIIDFAIQIKKCKKLNITFNGGEMILMILGLLIPFVSAYSNTIMLKKLKVFIKEHNFDIKVNMVPSIVTSVTVFPCFTNVVDLSIKNTILNKIAANM